MDAFFAMFELTRSHACGGIQGIDRTFAFRGSDGTKGISLGCFVGHHVYSTREYEGVCEGSGGKK